MHDSIFPCFDILAFLMKNMASGICGFGGMQLNFQMNPKLILFPSCFSFRKNWFEIELLSKRQVQFFIFYLVKLVEIVRKICFCDGNILKA
jgi:hypothetical protein